MSLSLIDRRLAGLLAALLLAIGVASASADLAASGGSAQIHARQAQA